MSATVLDKGGDLEVVPKYGKDLKHWGGMRMLVGPWREDNIAASQTDTALELCAEGASTALFRCHRAGSLTGITCNLTVTSAGGSVVFEVTKNGTTLAASGLLTVAAGALGGQATFDKDTYTFAAGDTLGLTFTTTAGWSSTTSDAGVWLEIET